jgi:phosphoribosylaminoimidazole-succinocarboxamide synthase
VDTDLEIPGARVCVGKVRDTYLLEGGNGEKTSSQPPLAVLVTTDRLSAFDRRIAAIPFKGQVLNETSAWWMRNTSHIVPNALLATPDPCVSVMKKCRVFPVEFVVRGFMTGSTDTSLWTHYSRGERDYCGNSFPDGMTKNQRLAKNVVTPTTKAEDHDEPISSAEIVSRGLMTQQQLDETAEAALKLFEFGQARASERGLLLVDTKYEFGIDEENGVITLIDEIHTPDSSRYWIGGSYEQRLSEGKEPESIDKEFIRLWFRERCDPYKDKSLPEAPRELRSELSRRYVSLFEKITGETFKPVDPKVPARERMRGNVQRCLEEIRKKV